MRMYLNSIVLCFAVILVVPSAEAEFLASNVHYRTTISGGKKSIAWDEARSGYATAQVYNLGGSVDFNPYVGLGLGLNLVNYNEDSLKEKHHSINGSELDLNATFSTPALNFAASKWVLYTTLGGTVESFYKVQSTTANAEERNSLRVKSNRDIDYETRFKKLSRHAALGLRVEPAENFGIFTQYKWAVEKWVNYGVKLEDQEEVLDGPDRHYDALKSREVTAGLQFIL